MVFEGTILFIGEIESVGANGLLKRTFVLEENTDKQYKDTIAIDLVKEEKVKLIDGFRVGDMVKAHIGFRANLSQTNGRYYNSISSWRIEASDATRIAPAATKDEDLPF
jgi:hypothetical protein